MQPIEQHRIDAKFDIGSPSWTIRERWRQTWHFWLTPALGTLIVGLMIFGLWPFSKLTLAAWLLAYLFHTWLLTDAVLWYWKFTDCVADAWGRALKTLSKETFEAGLRAGREAAKREEKPWL